MAERRQDFHQDRVAANLTNSSGSLRQTIGATAAYLQQHGYATADSMAAATARYYDQLYAQTRMLAFMDCFQIMGWMTLVASPLILLSVGLRPGTKASEGGH